MKKGCRMKLWPTCYHHNVKRTPRIDHDHWISQSYPKFHISCWQVNNLFHIKTFPAQVSATFRTSIPRWSVRKHGYNDNYHWPNWPDRNMTQRYLSGSCCREHLQSQTLSPTQSSYIRRWFERRTLTLEDLKAKYISSQLGDCERSGACSNGSTFPVPPWGRDSGTNGWDLVVLNGICLDKSLSLSTVMKQFWRCWGGAFKSTRFSNPRQDTLKVQQKYIETTFNFKLI